MKDGKKQRKSKETIYNPDFVKKIKRSEEDFKAGKFTAIKTKDLWT
jgi:hypothetical protein